MAIITKNEPTAAWLAHDRADWQKIYELLRMAQYEPVAELLHQAQLESEQIGDAVLSNMLAALSQISLACSQFQAGAEWHRRAYEEAGQREQELKRLLSIILALVGEAGLLDLTEQLATPTVALNRSGSELYRLWRRIQKLLGWESPAPSPSPELFERLIESPVVGTLQKIEPEQAESISPSLFVYCLGAFRVYHNEQLIEKWPGQKCKSLFKFMLIHRERPLHREVLMDLFWGEVDPEAARRNLHQVIYLLRQTLQTESPHFPYILSEDGCYRFNPELEVWIDSETFELHYEAGQQLERQGRLREALSEYESAESLYEGEFLTEDIYEDWTLVYRENLKHAYLNILDRLSWYYCTQEQFAQCNSYCQKILSVDSCREDAHCRLMRCYLRQGQRHLALRQYHLCVEALARELEVPPMPATVELYRQIQKNHL